MLVREPTTSVTLVRRSHHPCVCVCVCVYVRAPAHACVKSNIYFTLRSTPIGRCRGYVNQPFTLSFTSHQSVLRPDTAVTAGPSLLVDLWDAGDTLLTRLSFKSQHDTSVPLYLQHFRLAVFWLKACSIIFQDTSRRRIEKPTRKVTDLY